MTRSSKPDPNHDALSDSPVFGDLDDELMNDGFQDPMDSDEGEDFGDDPDDEDASLDEDWDDLAADEEVTTATRGPSPRRRRARSNTRPATAPKKPMLGFALIAIGLIFGLATIGAPTAFAGIRDALNALGLTPTAMLLAGAVLVAVHRLSAQSAAQTRQLVDEFESIAAQLESLGAPQEGGDLIAEQLDRVLLSTERQLEKIQNLTRATKMYGKPLVDISKQVADLSVHLSEVTKLPHQMESMLAADRDSESKEEVFDQLREIGRVARGTQSGVRELHENLGEALAKRIESLSAQIAATSVEIQNRQGNDDSEELTTIRREMQAITTGLSQLTVKVGQLPATVAKTAGAAAPASGSAGVSPQSAEAGTPPTDAAGGPTGDGVLAQKIAGARPAGKGVMSAIEKLKSMRG